MTTQEPPVLESLHGNWIEISLNRPEKLNPLDESLHRALFGALHKSAGDPAIRAILLTGHGRGFCAGQDLRERDPRNWQEVPDLSRTVAQKYNPLVRLVRDSPKPVVCAVNGLVAGAGIGLALACDIVLAAESAVFHLAFARIGLVPDAGTSWHLVHGLGPARARALALTGGQLAAREAAEQGMIWQCLPDDRLLAEARALVEKLANGSASALSLTKEVLRGACRNDFDSQLDLEARMQGLAGRSPDFAEGVLAFLERRPAQFTARDGGETA